MKKLLLAIISIFTIIVCLFFILILPGTFIVINWAEYPDYPEIIPIYYATNEISFLISGGRMSDTEITEKNIESIARNFLIENYFFPEDAVCSGVSYDYYRNSMYETLDVRFSREINNLRVEPADGISLSIRENGNIDIGYFCWKNYTRVGDALLISPEEAYNKLLNKEDLVQRPMQFQSIIVKEIQLCYWYIHEEYLLVPVWEFKGDDNSYYVKAYSSYEYTLEE